MKRGPKVMPWRFKVNYTSLQVYREGQYLGSLPLAVLSEILELNRNHGTEVIKGQISFIKERLSEASYGTETRRPPI